MSFIEIKGIEDVAERKAAPEGTYNLVIEDVEGKRKDNGTYQIVVRHGIEELDAKGNKYATVWHYLTMPGGDDDEEKRSAKLLFIKRYLVLAGINVSDGFEEGELMGAHFAATLTQSEYEGSISNKIFLPRLK